MNKYLKNLNKIEFVVTNACTGKCKHCSEGDHTGKCQMIDPSVAGETVTKICSVYDIKTVMAFGGEPLLHPRAVESIMRAATELGVPRRQVITNGYISDDEDKIRGICRMLSECSVNDLLLSVDAFHQETIPIETVRRFAIEAKNLGIPIRLQPAWLVRSDAENPYNGRTREVLLSLSDLSIPVGEGNVVFPEGNATKYLSEYFIDQHPNNPYKGDPFDVRCLSFAENGDVLESNIYKNDVLNIIKGYMPKKDIL